jgi:TetR/AcrR family transcriptional regulator, transcriptional repressor for nem operon
MARQSLRENIVEAATTVFHRAGFNGCTVEDITVAAGVPKGSFYNHFKSKEHLLLESMDRYGASGHLEILADAKTPPLKRLKKYFDALAAEFADSQYERGCLYGNLAAEIADHNHDVREKLGAVFAAWVDMLADVLRQAQRAGEISSSRDARTLAGFILSAWEGTLLRVRATRDMGLLKEFHRVVFGDLLK